MKTSLRIMIVAGASLLALSGQADAAPTLRTERVYFHCPPGATAPNGNVTQLADDLTATWDTTAPAASLAAGAGCNHLGNGLFLAVSYDSIYDIPFAGSFVGNLDAITYTFYGIPLGRGAQTSAVNAQVHLGIDGKSMFGTANSATGTPGPAPSKAVRVVGTRTATGLYRFELSVSGLQHVLQEGDGTRERTINVTIDTEDPSFALVYDAAEAPSGLTFNPATLATTKIAATTPGV